MSHASLIVALDGDLSPDAIHEAVAYQMLPFDEDGQWFADGSRWDWWVIGGRYSGLFAGRDVILRRDLDLTDVSVARRRKWADIYAEAMASESPHRNFLYGIKDGDTDVNAFLERRETEEGPLCAFAFLRNRVWHESSRMGWFGDDVKTECEIAAPDADTHICIHEKDGAKIVSWGKSEYFAPRFYSRFIKRLPPETALVCVDYHV